MLEGLRLHGRTVLVTGGAGFIGSELVARLVEDADVASVRVLDNLATGSETNLAPVAGHPRFELQHGDVTVRSDVERALDGVDVVFHLACLGVRHSLHDPMTNHRVNAEGSLLMLQAALERGVARYVHVSSSEVYGTATTVPMDERHPTRPETVYGAGKLAGEAYARAHARTYGMPVVVARPFNAYGPRSHFEGDSGEVIPRTIVRALGGLPALIYGDGRQTRDFTHVGDTAAGLIALAGCDAAIGRTLNLGSGAEVTINELARLIADLAGGPPAPRHLEPRPGDVRRLFADSGAMRELTGWRPAVDLRTGLAGLVEWFRGCEDSAEVMLGAVATRNWVA